MKTFSDHFSDARDTESAALRQGLLALLNARTLDAKLAIIDTNPGLLADSALHLLKRVAEAQRSEDARDSFLSLHYLLQRCQNIGVEAALAEHGVANSELEPVERLDEILKLLSSGAWLDDMPRRLDLWRRAFELIDREANPELWASLQFNLGNELAQSPYGERAENLEWAIASYESALEVRTRETMPADWASTQMNLANVYLQRIRGERAENVELSIKGYQSALQVRTLESMPREWATTQMNLANAYRNRIRGEMAENLELAIAGHKAALGVQTRQAMPREWATTQMNLANAYRDRIRGDRAENLEQAIAHYNLALEVRTRRSMPREWAMTQMNLSNSYLRRTRGNRSENVELAIEGYERALEVRTREALPNDWALAKMNLAIAYAERTRGDRAENLERAIAGYGAALEVRSREAFPVDWAQTQANLGNAYAQRIRGNRAENIELAIKCYEAVLEVQTREAMPVQWARTQMALANAYSELTQGDRAENLERGIACYESALQVLTREEMPVDWATTQMNLATAHVNRIRGEHAANLERAIAGYGAALEVQTRDGMPVDWAMTQMGLSTAYAERIRGERAENLERAIAGYEAALQIMRTGMPREHLRVQLSLGQLLFEAQRFKQACSTFRDALETQELLYRTAATAEARYLTLRTYSDIHPRLAYVLALEGDWQNLNEAITVAELGRARIMTETLALDEVPLTAARPADRLAFEDVRERIGVLQTRARLLSGTLGQSDFLNISMDLGQAYTELEAVITGIRVYIPEFLRQTSFIDIRLAAATCPLLYLITTTAGGVGLLVTAAGEVSIVRLPQLSENMVEEKVVQYLDAYSGRHQEPEAWLNALDDILRWLWDAGMGPVVSMLEGHREVVLIPGGLLGLLPLHATWRPDEGTFTRRHYAIDALNFRYAPSAGALIAAARSAAQTTADVILAVDEPKPVTGTGLPNSEREIQSAISYFGRNSRVLRHEAANRAALLAELPNYSVLHFCCHGFANLREPLEGGLVMANNEILSLRSFLETRLPNTRLAVLSACETAIPGTELPDEVLGLPSGLMQAGVDGVVGSLWSVWDESTMVLMCRFYNLWREEGLSPAEALRKAQQWVRDTTNSEKVEYFKRPVPEFAVTRMPLDSLYKQFSTRDPGARTFAHPFHWAAFCYFGV